MIDPIFIVCFFVIGLCLFIMYYCIRSRNRFFESIKKEFQSLENDYESLKREFRLQSDDLRSLKKENKDLKEEIDGFDKFAAEKVAPVKEKLESCEQKNQDLSDKVDRLSVDKRELERELRWKKKMSFKKDFDNAKLENRYRYIVNNFQKFKNLDSYQTVLKKACVLKLFESKGEYRFRDLMGVFPDISRGTMHNYLNDLESKNLLVKPVSGVYRCGKHLRDCDCDSALDYINLVFPMDFKEFFSLLNEGRNMF